MYKVKVKGVVLGGKVDGSAGGPPTTEQPKEVKKKKLRKTCDLSIKVPLSLSDIIRKRKYDEKKNYEVNYVPESQDEIADQSTKEALEVVPIQMIILVNIQGNISKTKPSKKIDDNVVNNVS